MSNNTIDFTWDETPVDITQEANMIWSIANKIRNSFMPDHYGDVIIPMTILRRFEGTLEKTKEKVVQKFKEDPTYPVKALCKLSGFQFYNTSSFTLKEIKNDEENLLANFKSYIDGFSEAKLRDEFDKDQYQVLIVADKYQTGFVQKKLCAMYILKKLHDVSVVQTLSRLNRIYPPFDKKTFILDFANDYGDITKAFAPYYTCTTLNNNVTPASCYAIYDRLLGYKVFYDYDVEEFVNLRFSEQQTSAQKKKMIGLLQKAARDIRDCAKYDPLRPKEIKKDVRAFIRCYEFLIQVTSLNDRTLHKMYIFLGYLKTLLDEDQPGQGIDISDKIKAEDFMQKKKEEHKKSHLVADPNVKLSNADKVNFAPEKRARLSEIIAEINSKTGKAFDEDVAYATIIQIKEMMKKNEDLKRSAKTNTLNDFAFTYNDKIDEVLLDGLEQNRDFYSLLLENKEIKHEFMDLFTEDVYESCGGKGVYAVSYSKDSKGDVAH